MLHCTLCLVVLYQRFCVGYHHLVLYLVVDKFMLYDQHGFLGNDLKYFDVCEEDHNSGYSYHFHTLILQMHLLRMNINQCVCFHQNTSLSSETGNFKNTILKKNGKITYHFDNNSHYKKCKHYCSC